MIENIDIHNFKGVKDVRTSLERLTVFVGPNGSGKTSVLQGLDLLVQAGRLGKYSDLNKKIFDRGYRDRYSDNSLLEVTGTTSIGEIRLVVTPLHPELLSEDPFDSPDEEEVFSFEGRDKKSTVDEWKSIRDLHGLLPSLGRGELFRFDPSKMAEPSSGVGTQMAPDGTGLSSYLAFLALNRPDDFSYLQQEFTTIVPAIQRIRFGRSQSHQRQERVRSGNRPEFYFLTITLDEIIFDLKSGVSISAKAASEGTLLILALLAALVGNNNRSPYLILVDDLDRGLHPLAQRDIISLLRKIQERQPNLQIVATTHSPYLVDCLLFEEIRMTTLNDDGTVACGRLIDHPKFDQWKDEMAPGELWSMFGEKWISQSSRSDEALQ